MYKDSPYTVKKEYMVSAFCNVQGLPLYRELGSVYFFRLKEKERSIASAAIPVMKSTAAPGMFSVPNASWSRAISEKLYTAVIRTFVNGWR